MSYVAILHDGTEKKFPASGLNAVNQAMREKLPVELEGLPVSGASISRIERERHREYGPHMSFDQVAHEFARLPEGERRIGFWEQAFNLNKERNRSGKRWLFAPVVEWVRTHTALTNPADICEFLDSQWTSELEALSRPDRRAGQYREETWALCQAALDAGKITEHDLMMAR